MWEVKFLTDDVQTSVVCGSFDEAVEWFYIVLNHTGMVSIIYLE